MKKDDGQQKRFKNTLKVDVQKCNTDINNAKYTDLVKKWNHLNKTDT